MSRRLESSDICMSSTRHRIIQESIKLFQRHGYHGTAVSAILKAAKTPKGSLYHHFPKGKEEVASAALEWLTSEIVTFLHARDEEGATGQNMLTGMAKFYGKFSMSKGTVRGSLIAVLASECIPGSKRLSKELAASISEIEAVLKRGFVRQGVSDPAGAAVRSLALLEGAFLMNRIKGEQVDPILLIQDLGKHLD